MTAISEWTPLPAVPWGQVMAASDGKHALEVTWALHNGRPDTISRRWTTTGHPVRRAQHDREDAIIRNMQQAIETALGGRAQWLAAIGAREEASQLREIVARSRGPVPRKARYPDELLDEAAAEYKRARADGEYPVQATERLLARRGYQARRARRILTRCRETGRI
jgi:hypothetical protein